MYDVYRDFMIKRSQGSRSISHRASLVPYFVVDDKRVLENDGIQLLFRAPNAPTSDRQTATPKIVPRNNVTVHSIKRLL